MDVGFHLGAIFEETFGVAEFEIEVMVVCIGAEADFFDDGFSRFCLDLLFLLFAFVKELVVVNDFYNGRFSIRGDFNEVEFGLFGPFSGPAGRIDNTGLYGLADNAGNFFEVITNQAYFGNPYLFVDSEVEFGAGNFVPSGISLCQ